MANSTLCCYDANFRFTVDIKKLASKSVTSSEIRLSGVNWKVKVEKKSIKKFKKKVLGIYLMSEFDDKSKGWSCGAQAAFKLLPKDDDKMEQSIVKYLPRQKFTNDERSHGFNEFIQWNAFLEDFVDKNKNKAIFEIEISTEPSIRTIGLDVDQKYGKFRVNVKNIDKLGRCDSPKTVVRGIKWWLCTKKDDDKLSLYLYADGNDLNINCFCEVEATFQLLSFDKKVAPVKKSLTQEFPFYGSNWNWGYKEFLKWSDFISADNSYVRNNTAIVDVEIKVNEPKPQWKIGDYNLSKENSL